MANRLLFTLLISFFSTCFLAQEHHLDMSSGKLEIIDLNRVTLVGHSGSNVIITKQPIENEHEQEENLEKDWEKDDDRSNKEQSPKTDRSAGLRMINAAGQSDNTGLGIHVKETEGGALVTAISNSQKNRYIVQVPAAVKVYYEHNGFNGGLLEIKDIDAEVEASVHHNSVKFENVGGPIVAKAVYGTIEGIASSNNSSLSLHSTYGLIDVSVPKDGKRDIVLQTTYGQMYTDFDIEAKEERKRSCDWCAKSMVGTINGGGNQISLSSTYSNIYLRKS